MSTGCSKYIVYIDGPKCVLNKIKQGQKISGKMPCTNCLSVITKFYVPFLVFVADKKLIELLTFEF